MIRIEKTSGGYEVSAVGTSKELLSELVDLAATLNMHMMGKNAKSIGAVMRVSQFFSLAVGARMEEICMRGVAAMSEIRMESGEGGELQ